MSNRERQHGSVTRINDANEVLCIGCESCEHHAWVGTRDADRGQLIFGFAFEALGEQPVHRVRLRSEHVPLQHELVCIVSGTRTVAKKHAGARQHQPVSAVAVELAEHEHGEPPVLAAAERGIGRWVAKSDADDGQRRGERPAVTGAGAAADAEGKSEIVHEVKLEVAEVGFTEGGSSETSFSFRLQNDRRRAQEWGGNTVK